MMILVLVRVVEEPMIITTKLLRILIILVIGTA